VFKRLNQIQRRVTVVQRGNDCLFLTIRYIVELLSRRHVSWSVLFITQTRMTYKYIISVLSKRPRRILIRSHIGPSSLLRVFKLANTYRGRYVVRSYAANKNERNV